MTKAANSLPDTASQSPIEDVQGRADTRQIAINKVGIRDIRYPIKIQGRNGVQQTVANFSMTVNLPQEFKGTHMSRFIEILEAHDEPLCVESFREVLSDMTKKLESDDGFVEINFPYFVNKTAPISGVSSMLDYEASFVGEKRGDQVDVYLKTVVSATSLCPCSKKISEYGAHNQRSHITITALTNPNEPALVLEDLIDIAEREASCELFGILKRPDEKYVTERAYNNPKFVEDIVRDVAAALNNDNRVLKYIAESENFESIHNHSAYALIENDKR